MTEMTWWISGVGEKVNRRVLDLDPGTRLEDGLPELELGAREEVAGVGSPGMGTSSSGGAARRQRTAGGGAWRGGGALPVTAGR